MNMTCEQFVFWLSGYLTAGRDNDTDISIEEITKVIKTVINPQLQNTQVFFAET